LHYTIQGPLLEHPRLASECLQFCDDSSAFVALRNPMIRTPFNTRQLTPLILYFSFTQVITRTGICEESMALPFSHWQQFRVRYSETDQLGTFYNSRALEWFECGRTEILRALGVPYASLESKGLFLPLVEAHVQYLGRACYDDLLEMTTTLSLAGKASLRFDVKIVHAGTSNPVASGYTLHAMTEQKGKPTRCPAWLSSALHGQSSAHGATPASGSSP
jgi:acyl-CoA thioester hydrolase